MPAVWATDRHHATGKSGKATRGAKVASQETGHRGRLREHIGRGVPIGLGLLLESQAAFALTTSTQKRLWWHSFEAQLDDVSSSSTPF